MTSKPTYKHFLCIMIIWSTSALVGCSTFRPTPAATVTALASSTFTLTPAPTETATATASLTQTPAPSATVALAPKSSPTPYNGPNTLYYIQDDNQLFSINADGSNHREIAQGIQFTVSPDKKKIVYRTAETIGSNNDEMIVLDVEQNKVAFRWKIPGYCEGFFMSSRFTWSPDSRKIAFILVRHDLGDPLPSCKLAYNYENWGIYQIDLISANITHPPLPDRILDALSASITLPYSPDGSKLRLGPRGEMFDIETWETVTPEPYYGALELCDRPEKISICDAYNLCVHGQKNYERSRHLTDYSASHEAVVTFKLSSDCSVVAYQTEDKELHVLSLSSEEDQRISTNVWEYFFSPDNSKLVLYEQDRLMEEAYIFVVNSDGSHQYPIAEFPRRKAAIHGLLMSLSPTGEKVAFVNRDGIAIIDLDGGDFIQLVNLPDGAPLSETSLEILSWH